MGSSEWKEPKKYYCRQLFVDQNIKINEFLYRSCTTKEFFSGVKF